MIYCISDIHGEYERYLTMLRLINFSEHDTLYVLGDVIDRYPDGVDILLDIMQRPNVRMILGNHEIMCLGTLGPNNYAGIRQLWEQNGGSCTRQDLLYHRTAEERKKILSFLDKLPDCYDIEVNGQQFHLVHAYPSEDGYDRLWKRPEVDEPAPLPGKTAIVGHTPTAYLTGKKNEPYHIWYGNGIIDIDCGCGKKTEFRRLACLRLDDMQEFYV